MHKETIRKIVGQSIKKGYVITSYTKPMQSSLNKYADLKIFDLPETLKKEKCAELINYIVMCQNLKRYFLDNWEKIKFEMEKEAEQHANDGYKNRAVNDKAIISNIFKKALQVGVWPNDQFTKYEVNKQKSLVFVEKRNLYYEAGNNSHVDFYSKNGVLCWDIVRCFDVNSPKYIPLWQKEGGRIIWSVHQHDLLEILTPDEWGANIKNKKCIVRVKKISAGITIVPINCCNEDLMLSDRGLSFFIKAHARKIELTPFGKIKKKHKVLSNGAATAA